MPTTFSFDQFLNALFYVSLAGAAITAFLVYRMNKKAEH